MTLINISNLNLLLTKVLRPNSVIVQSRPSCSSRSAQLFFIVNRNLVIYIMRAKSIHTTALKPSTSLKENNNNKHKFIIKKAIIFYYYYSPTTLNLKI